MYNHSLTIFIPSYNEVTNISETIYSVTNSLQGLELDFEIIVFDDGSTDGTEAVVRELMQTNANIRIFRNEINRGLGYAYRKGIEIAKKEYFMLVPGDNEIAPQSIRKIVEQLGNADIVIPYFENMQSRSWHRRVLSVCFTLIANTLNGLNIKYYNGPVLHYRKNLQNIKILTDSFAYQFEILTQLFRQKYTYVYVPIQINPRKQGESQALKWKNIFQVLKSLIEINWRLRCN